MTRYQSLVLKALIVLLRHVASKRGYSVGDPYFAAHQLACQIEDETKRAAVTFGHMEERG